MKENNNFLRGIADGIPVCLGYLSVAFAFGIFATDKGLSIIQTLLISMTNVTSAGQLAMVPIIAVGGTLTELAISQFVINLRYALMSVSLSQKLGKSVNMFDRFVISFVNTDEVFAIATSNKFLVGKKYLYGLILTPYLGWSAGTLIGAGAGNILPLGITSALGIAIYAMFVAIVMPEAKKHTQTALCVLCAIVFSCLFKYMPLLKSVPDGFTIIICAALSSVIFALFAPIQNEDEDGEQK
ncbi:MAG: AzlC family ABC transporter permease [Ruminococcaceae bacterium]|nr:AzlC family ABC transporter permease [Oscillospiraceae bacterium]